jgi:hypothetical protein
VNNSWHTTNTFSYPHNTSLIRSPQLHIKMIMSRGSSKPLVKGKEPNGLPMKGGLAKFLRTRGSNILLTKTKNSSKHLRRNKSSKQITTLDPATWTVHHLIRLNIQHQCAQDSTTATPFTFPYNEEAYRVLISIIYNERPSRYFYYPISPTIDLDWLDHVVSSCEEILDNLKYEPDMTSITTGYFVRAMLEFLCHHILPSYSGGKFHVFDFKGRCDWCVVSPPPPPTSRIITK